MIGGRKRFQFLVVLIALCYGNPRAFSAPSVASAQMPATAAPFSLVISVVQDAFQAGLPIKINVVTTNTSGSLLHFWQPNHGDRTFLYDVEMCNERGDSPPVVFGFSLGGSGGEVPLEPGDSMTDVIDLNELFYLSEPGKYTVQLRPREFGSSQEYAAPESNKITIALTAAQNPRETAATPSGAASISLTLKSPCDNLSSITIQSACLYVGLEVDIANTSGGTVVLPVTAMPYTIVVRDSTGHRVKEKPGGSSSSSGGGAVVEGTPTKLVLKPGQTWRDRIELIALYDLSKPGQYTVQVQWPDPVTGITVSSNTITLTLAPTP